MLTQKFRRTKLACYTAYFTMSSIFCVPPLLFVTLREMYGISYTLLGTLVLTNFCTQLIIDLIFTAFSKHFNIAKVVRVPRPLMAGASMTSPDPPTTICPRERLTIALRVLITTAMLTATTICFAAVSGYTAEAIIGLPVWRLWWIATTAICRTITN